MSKAETQPKYTPMMEQYRSVKKELSEDTILFFRLGDFYEMFFEDAEKAADILKITLTGRSAGAAGRVPMCGVPYHSHQSYVKTLIHRNLKVAICEQVGDPKASKGLVERKVTRLITPATYIEESSKQSQPEYLCALVGEDDLFALAFADMSTGEFKVREILREKMQSELMLLEPREVIIPETLSKEKGLVAFLKDNLKSSVTAYEDWIFESKEAARLIEENFKGATRHFEVSDKKLSIAACGAILYYLRDHLYERLGHLQVPVVLHDHEFMPLDRQTQRSLELVTTVGGDKEGPTLLNLMDRTLTSMGSRTLRYWLTHPLIDLEKITGRQEAVSQFVEAAPLLREIRESLRCVRDMERALGRLNCGVANARDVVNLRDFLVRVPGYKEKLKPLKGKVIAEVYDSLQPFENLQSAISSCLVDEPPLGLKDGGLIKDGYQGELDELRDISRNGKKWLADFEKRESERTGIRTLKIKYSQVFGYTIDVSKSNAHLVPEDYIRKQTLANAERYIVPELKTWDEKISGAQDKIKALEYKLFDDLRNKILESLLPLQNMARAVGALDALLSLASLANEKQWIRPVLSKDSVLHIREGRHPVVEDMLPAGDFIENDCLLNNEDHQLILLTGPNMAGKSTYIRQVAILVILAQMGSYVPAKEFLLGVVDRVFTRIGAADDLARGESTFMVEMLETAHILRSATSKSLIILDEVGRGTSTFDGVSIAWSICEYLLQGEERPRALFATHYHELTQLEEHFQGIKNYHVAVKENRGHVIFLRKVLKGASDRSYGIHVAKLAGIPHTILGRAMEIMHVLESESAQASEKLDGIAGSQPKRPDFQQPTLFDLSAKDDKLEPHPLISEIEELNLNEMTPLEALNTIHELKQKIKAEA